MSPAPTPPPWSPRPVEILVVEDTPADLRLLQISFDSHNMPAQLHAVPSGTEALAFLEDNPRPDLVLLDLKMSGMSGHEVLASMKQDPRLSQIPVVVLSNSDDPGDVSESYRLQAAAFLQKPDSLEGYAQLVQAFSDFWLRVALLPR